MNLVSLFKNSLKNILTSCYDYDVIKTLPSDWAEKNIYLTSAESVRTGYLSYDFSPYTKEIINNLSPDNTVEMVAVMKGSQSGYTQSVLVPGMCYVISESPANILFLSGNETLVKNTIRGRLDTAIHNNENIKKLIRTNVQKKRNARSGDTDTQKEFAGGTLTAVTYKPSNLRFYSVKYIFADEYDDAPKIDKKEGSIRELLEGRTKSFGNRRKMFFGSTPTVKSVSNIYEVFLMGDQRQWNWECPSCIKYFPVLWKIEKENGTFAGIKWELDSNNELIEDSVHFECPHCSHKIKYKEKYDLNLKGKWVPTAKPYKEGYRSYQFNSLFIPPGFISWVDLVKKFLSACPPNGQIDEDKLKAFLNQELGEVWEEKGKSLKSSLLQENCRTYKPGIIPDETIKEDDNGVIVLVSLSCDLGGIMDRQSGYYDVRLDWEITAHTSRGQTYSINHGSIGTFKRSRHKSAKDKMMDNARELWTYDLNVKNSVWPELEKIINTPIKGESGRYYPVEITLIDTGYSFDDKEKAANEKFVKNFIEIQKGLVIGIKGHFDKSHTNTNTDKKIVKRSINLKEKLYIIEVERIKDLLSQNVNQSRGIDGFQPSGFMNFPISDNGKYTYKNYFKHFEAEHRIPVIENGVEVGYKWQKKHSHVENHFFDIAVYNLASKYIYLDILRSTSKDMQNLTWEDFCLLIENS